MSDPQAPPPRRPRVPGAARGHIAAHVQEEKKPFPWLIVGAVLVVLAIAGYFLLNDPGKFERELGQQLGNPEAYSLPSGKGQRGSLTLKDEDETVLKLGSESSVKIPASFDDKVRGVSVNGTGVFTVKPLKSDTAKPFRVRLRNVDVWSKGGTFAVRAYENEEKEVLVVAREGQLMLNPNNAKGISQPLEVGSGVAVDKDAKIRPLTKDEIDQAFSWADGTLTVMNVPLSQMVLVIDRWFSTVVRLEKGIENKTVTAAIPLESSKIALDAVSTAASVHTVFHGDSLFLADGAPPVAPVKPAPKGKKGK